MSTFKFVCMCMFLSTSMSVSMSMSMSMSVSISLPYPHGVSIGLRLNFEGLWSELHRQHPVQQQVSHDKGPHVDKLFGQHVGIWFVIGEPFAKGGFGEVRFGCEFSHLERKSTTAHIPSIKNGEAIEKTHHYHAQKYTKKNHVATFLRPCASGSLYPVLSSKTWSYSVSLTSSYPASLSCTQITSRCRPNGSPWRWSPSTIAVCVTCPRNTTSTVFWATPPAFRAATTTAFVALCTTPW